MNSPAGIRSSGLLLTVLVSAFALRLAAFPVFHSHGYTSDEREYIYLASKVAAGGEFVDSNGEYSTRSPLFPMTLGLLFRVFGTGLLVPHLLGCMLGTLVVFLGYHLAKLLTNDEWVGIVTAVFMSVYPGLVIYSGILQTETLYMVFFLFVLIMSAEMLQRPSPLNGAVFGIAAGFAALTRAVFVGFFPAVVVALGLMMNDKKIRLLSVAIILFCTVLAPWTLRNYMVHGEFVPVSSWGGISLLTGNNPYATGTWSTKAGFNGWREQEAKRLGYGDYQLLAETQRSAASKRIAFDYVMAHPVDAIVLALKKAHMMLFYPIANSDSDTRTQALAVAGEAVLYMLGIVGIVSIGQWKREFTLPMMAVLFFIILQVVLHAEARYRLPLVPLFCIPAAIGLQSLIRKEERIALLGNKTKAVLVVCGVAVVAAVYAYTGWMFLQGSV